MACKIAPVFFVSLPTTKVKKNNETSHGSRRNKTWNLNSFPHFFKGLFFSILAHKTSPGFQVNPKAIGRQVEKKKMIGSRGDLTILRPFVLASDLFLFIRCKVILDVEGFANLLRRFSFDHIRNRLTTNVKKGLDIEIIRGKNYFEQHFLVNLHELLIPFVDIGRLLPAIGVIVGLSRGITLVMLAPLDNLLQNVFIDVRNRYSLSYFTNILKHVLDQNGTLSHGFLHGDRSLIGAEKLDLGHLDNLTYQIVCSEKVYRCVLGGEECV